MTRIQGAVIREQGQSFAVVIVKPSVIHNRSAANATACQLSGVFNGLPVVLMAQDSRGRPTYYGRPDIARFLGSLHVSQIPWRHYTIS